MSFIVGILKRILKCLLYIAVVIAIILLIPNLPPYTKFTSIEIEPTKPRVGVLAPNGVLNNVEKLYLDKLAGPEAFQLWNDEVYTGLATGELVKISRGGHVTFVTQLGQPCTGVVHEHICGRPLGFDIDDKNKQLYVADAYLGIWRVDLKTNKKQLLVSPQVAIEGRKPMLFNSVALANNGDLYWTDSSSEYQLKDGVFAIISDPSGRLFHYNPAKNASTVLLDNLWFPNGVVVSRDNQFVLVAETNMMRVLKYYINGPKKGLTEVFVSGLPGIPDTIRLLPDGSGVLIALYAASDDDHPLLLSSLAAAPLARKAAARVMRLLEIPFEFLNNQFPHIVFEQIVYTIGHFATVSGVGPGLSGLVQVDWNGNIVAAYDNRDHSMYAISDAIVFNDKLLLGSPHKQNFIAAVPVPPLLKKAFTPPKAVPEKQIPKKVEEVKVAPKIEKPVEQKPTPKTTTEKPSSAGDRVKTVPQKQTEAKANTVPRGTVKQPVKEEIKKTTPKAAESKPKKEAVTESLKTKTETVPTPAPKTEPKKQAAPESKVVPETKPKVVNKVESKKESMAEPSPIETKPKAESKKDATGKSEKPAAAPTTAKPEKPKTKKKAKKAQEEEPQIIVQKVVPDEIPIIEEIPSDTVKPKDESLKVIKKTGPTEIPIPNV